MDTSSVTNSNQPGSSSRIGESCDLVYKYTIHATMYLINNHVITCPQFCHNKNGSNTLGTPCKVGPIPLFTDTFDTKYKVKISNRYQCKYR